MVKDDLFTSHKFKKLTSSIKDYDPTLHRKGIVDMVCSTIIDNSPDIRNHFLVTGTGITSIKEVFNKCCDQIDSELGKHMLVEKIYIVISLMFHIVKVFLHTGRVLEYEEVMKINAKKTRCKIVTREFVAEWLQLVYVNVSCVKENIIKELMDQCKEEFESSNEGQEIDKLCLFVLSGRIMQFISDKTKDKNVVTTNEVMQSEAGEGVFRLVSERFKK